MRARQTRDERGCANRTGLLVRRHDVSNPQHDRLREPAWPLLHAPTSSRRWIDGGIRTWLGQTDKTELINGPDQHHRHDNRHRGFVFLHGQQRIHYGRVLMGVAIIVIVVLMRKRRLLALMAGGGMRSVAVIRLCEMLHSSAVADIASMKPKRLRPANREKREEAENKTICAWSLHVGGK